MEKKVWGEYSTYKNPEAIANLPEEDIWKRIDNLKTTLSLYARNPLARVPREQLVSKRYNLEYLVYLTRKFGVEFESIPSEERHVESSESFKSWFTFWKNYFNNMSEDDYEEFVEAKYEGKDISSFLPEKSWQETYTNSK